MHALSSRMHGLASLRSMSLIMPGRFHLPAMLGLLHAVAAASVALVSFRLMHTGNVAPEMIVPGSLRINGSNDDQRDDGHDNGIRDEFFHLSFTSLISWIYHSIG